MCQHGRRSLWNKAGDTLHISFSTFFFFFEKISRHLKSISFSSTITPWLVACMTDRFLTHSLQHLKRTRLLCHSDDKCLPKVGIIGGALAGNGHALKGQQKRTFRGPLAKKRHSSAMTGSHSQLDRSQAKSCSQSWRQSQGVHFFSNNNNLWARRRAKHALGARPPPKDLW